MTSQKIPKKHFEELWEECEQNYTNSQLDHNQLINSLIMKLELYNKMNQALPSSNEEKASIIFRLYGEILLTLTALSLKDNVNVFKALDYALSTNKKI